MHFTRTLDHPVITNLKEEGVNFTSFDYLYEREKGFETVYEEIVKILLEHAQEKSIIYSVPGHPMLAETTVQLLLNQQEV